MLSIIIPTYKREQVLCDTLTSILGEIESETINAEVIVVDQTVKHSEATSSFLGKLQDKKKIRVEQLMSPSLPCARNRGIEVAKGEIIIFFDDDVILEKNCLRHYIEAFECDYVNSVVGRVSLANKDKKNNILLLSRNPLKEKIKKTIIKLTAKGKGYKMTRLGVVLNNLDSYRKGFVDGGMGCNMAFRKNVFEEVGLFDVNYIGNALREETDMFVRLKERGLKILFEPHAHIFHLMSNIGGCRSELNSSYWETYFYNQSYFYLKNFGFSRWRIATLLAFDIIYCISKGLPIYDIFQKAFVRAKSVLMKPGDIS